MNERHTYITYIAKSKTGSKEMQVIHFDQEVQVCGLFSNPNIFFGIPLVLTFSLSIIALEVWDISLFSQYSGNFMCYILFFLFYCYFESFMCLSLFLSIAVGGLYQSNMTAN
jgi:hypothetical protein